MGMKEIKGTIAKVIIGVFEGGKLIKSLFTRDVFVGGDIDPVTGEWSPNGGSGSSKLNVSGEATVNGRTNLRASTITRDLRVGGAYDVNGNWGPKNVLLVDHTPFNASVKNSLYISTMKISERGRYWLVLPAGSNYLYKMQITEADGTRVFDVSDMPVITAGAYGDATAYNVGNGIYVIFSAKTRVDDSTKTFDDGFVGQKRLNFQKATEYEYDYDKNSFPSVRFETNGAAEVKIWWAAGDNNRYFAIQSDKASGPSRLDVSGSFYAHGNADVQERLTAHGDIDCYGKVTASNGIDCQDDISISGTATIDNDLHVGGYIDCHESLEMNGNDIKNVQSLRMKGTLEVENDSKLRSIKPKEDGRFNIGTEENSYDRVYANRHIIKDKATGKTELIDYSRAKALNYHLKDDKTLVLSSTTEGSRKVFKISVDDTGALKAVEWPPVYFKGTYGWYNGSLAKSNITKVTFAIDYQETEPADETLDVSTNGDGSVICYRYGTELVIAANDTHCFKTDKSYGLFYQFKALADLDISRLDISGCTSLEGAFQDCRSLTSLDVSNFDTSNVTNMYFTFYQCAELKSLDLRNFDFSKVTNMSNTFYACIKLTDLSLVGPIKYSGLNFSACYELTHGSLMNVINALYDGTIDGLGRTIRLGSTNLAKLTAAEKQIMTNKGWTYS